MKNINNLLSKVAKNIIPYKWEEDISENALRFDTNTLPTPPKSLRVFLRSLESDCPINEYTDPSYARLKKLIADYESVGPNMVTVTNSGDEAIDILAKAFLDPGDYFIITPPTYEMFRIQCEINGGRSLEVPLERETFAVDNEKIIGKSKDPKVKLIFLCNPNNPTGSVISQNMIKRIVQNSQVIVVVDEAYREFYGKRSVPLLKKYQNLVILRSFSKFAGLAGARVGYLIANQFLSQKFDGIRFPMGVSLFSYKLAETVLEKDKVWMKKQVGMIKRERNRVTAELKKLGFYVFPSEANFLLVKVGRRAKILCQKLREKGIIIRDRSGKKYLESCVRITVRSPQENNRLLRRIKEVL